jgi:hypothetical protein
MVATYSEILEILKEGGGGQLGPKGDEYIVFMIKGALRMEQLLRDLRAYVLASSAGQEPTEDVDADLILNNGSPTLGLRSTRAELPSATPTFPALASTSSN